MDTIEWDTIGKEDAQAVEAVTEYEKVLQKSQKTVAGALSPPKNMNGLKLAKNRQKTEDCVLQKY